jgi:hypothetical protein
MPFLVSFVLPILWRTEIRVVLRHRYQKSWRRKQGWFYVQIGIYFISVDALNFTITWPKKRDNPERGGIPKSVSIIRHLQESCDSDQHYTECYNKCLPIATQVTYIKIIRRIATIWVWRGNILCQVAEDFHSITEGLLLVLTAKSSKRFLFLFTIPSFILWLKLIWIYYETYSIKINLLAVPLIVILAFLAEKVRSISI